MRWGFVPRHDSQDEGSGLSFFISVCAVCAVCLSVSVYLSVLSVLSRCLCILSADVVFLLLSFLLLSVYGSLLVAVLFVMWDGWFCCDIRGVRFIQTRPRA